MRTFTRFRVNAYELLESVAVVPSRAESWLVDAAPETIDECATAALLRIGTTSPRCACSIRTSIGDR